MSDEQFSRVRAMRSDGTPLHVIAATTGLPKSAVYRVTMDLPSTWAVKRKRAAECLAQGMSQVEAARASGASVPTIWRMNKEARRAA